MLELAGIIVLGISAQWLAWKSHIPAILPLILIGLAVGPIAEHFFGMKLIEPIYNNDHGLFPQPMLFHFVSLAIGVILFEGGLTLKLSEFKNVGRAVVHLISIGAFVTLIGGTISATIIWGLEWRVALLFAALIVVTGPTVIAPILRNVPLNKNVATVLRWEGILIDPIGALIAVLVFEFIVSTEANFTLTALKDFFSVVTVGIGLGISAGIILGQFIKRKWIPHYLVNVGTLAAVLAVFAQADALAHESGLLATVVMGMTMGNMDIPKIKNMLDFKESLTILLISILFILLSANMNMEDLMKLWNVRSLSLFAAVVFVIRPMSVFVSTMQDKSLTFNEKLFISWVGPRGIVAAGIASVFGLKLVEKGNVAGAEMITPLVFLIVLGTVLLNATTARIVAKWLNVILDKSNGIVIVGANIASRVIGKYLEGNSRHVVLIDASEEKVKKAKSEGFEAIHEDIFNEEAFDHFELLDMGYLLALSGSDRVNEFACKSLKAHLGENGSFRLISDEEFQQKDIKEPDCVMFSKISDYIHITEIAREFPTIFEIELNDQTHFESLADKIDRLHERVPLFIKRFEEEEIEVILAENYPTNIEKGDKLVYLGKKINDYVPTQN